MTGCVVRFGGGRPNEARSWVAVPERDIPAGATAVHGWTTEAARSAGRPARVVVAEMISELAWAVSLGWPIVIMNAPFDLTLLDRAARRLGVTPLTDVAKPYVLDPRVLDKRVDRWRKGHRTLTDLCRHWCVPIEGAHDSAVDAVAACRVTWKIAHRAWWMQRMTLDELHTQQVRWAYEQQTGFRDYLARTSGREHEAAGVRLDWPLALAPVAGDPA